MKFNKILIYVTAIAAISLVTILASNINPSAIATNVFSFLNVFYSIRIILFFYLGVAPGSLLSSIAFFILPPVFVCFYYFTWTNQKSNTAQVFYYFFIITSLMLAWLLIFTGAQMISNPPPNAEGIGIKPGGFDQFLAVTGLILFNLLLIKKWKEIKWITFGKTFLNYFLFLFEVIISISVSIIVYNLGLMNNATPTDLLFRILSTVFIGLFAFFFLQEARNKLKG